MRAFLVSCFLVCTCHAANFNLVQSKFVNGSTSVAFTSNVTAGNAILIGISGYNTAVVPTDSQSDTFTCQLISNARINLCSALRVNGGATTVSVSGGSVTISGGPVLLAEEISSTLSYSVAFGAQLTSGNNMTMTVGSFTSATESFIFFVLLNTGGNGCNSPAFSVTTGTLDLCAGNGTFGSVDAGHDDRTAIVTYSNTVLAGAGGTQWATMVLYLPVATFVQTQLFPILP